jgi:Treacher Collins syndrome protein Treacle
MKPAAPTTAPTPTAAPAATLVASTRQQQQQTSFARKVSAKPIVAVAAAGKAGASLEQPRERSVARVAYSDDDASDDRSSSEDETMQELIGRMKGEI